MLNLDQKEIYRGQLVKLVRALIKLKAIRFTVSNQNFLFCIVKDFNVLSVEREDTSITIRLEAFSKPLVQERSYDRDLIIFFEMRVYEYLEATSKELLTFLGDRYGKPR